VVAIPVVTVGHAVVSVPALAPSAVPCLLHHA
jgi:hypothetical protein